MEIGTILYQLRNQHNFTQEAISNELGISITTYSRYEKDQTEIRITYLKQLAKLYGMTVDEVLNYDPKKLISSSGEVYEPKSPYYAKKRISVSIDLDGNPIKLQESFDLLNKINGMVNEIVKNSAA